MKVIGLTGNIATGKSQVLRMLEELGAYTLDADAVVHSLLKPGTETYWDVVRTFGRGILRPNGEIDRARLAAIVFPAPEALAQLEAILYPAVDAEVGDWLQSLERRVANESPEPGHPLIAVVDAVKLLESPVVQRCDQIWVVTARPEQQLERLVQQRGMSEEHARARLEAQPSADAHLERADVVIDNSGTLEETRAQVRAAWQRMASEA